MKEKAKEVIRCDRCGKVSIRPVSWITLSIERGEESEQIDLCGDCHRNLEAFIWGRNRNENRG